MSLNMYLGEVQNQTQSMNAVCTATIQGMEQVIQSIDAFATDTVLQGRTYSSAKIFFVQTFRPLAQGIIYLCEELIRQNDAFPRDFQSQVASTDVIEQEVREQIQEINQMIASIEVIDEATPMPGIDAIVAVLVEMRKKLEEKLEHLYEFNYTSSNNYSTALQLAASIATGLAEVQSGKGFSPVSGTFSTQGLNMEWTTSIQAITEEKKHHSEEISIIEESLFDKFKDTVGNNVEAMNQLYEKFIHQIENTPLIGQYYNYKKGQNEAVLDELKGILNTILHPIDSVEGAVYALSHINETFAAVEQAISDSWNQDVVNGDWNSRAKWYGNVEMKVKLAIAELFVGTKGVDKVSTLGKTSKLSESVNFIQGTKNVITLDKFKQSVDMLNNILMPKNQFAYAGANSIHSKLDTPDFHRVEEKLSTHQFAKGEVSSSGNKGTGKGSKIEDISKLTTEDIPTAKSGKFNDFFNSLSSAELDELWKDKKIRKKIERQLREPGGLHEWHLVSRAPQFKFWDISAEKIKDLRTAISDVKFVNPKGVHGGLGSTKAHNELLAIIDTSNDYNTFIRRLNNWAYYRLEGGISSLPEGLRLK